jgi:general secretion pathway protein H
MARRAAKAMTPTFKNSAVSGFTLLELLIVLSLIAIATGLLLPNLALTDSAAFTAEVRRAGAVLTHARRVAIVKGTPVTASFVTLEPDAADYADQRVLVENREQQWSSDTIALNFQDEFDVRAERRAAIAVTFYPQGGSTGGVLGFAQDSRSARIRVDAVTGRIVTAFDGEEFDDAL